ncbi:sigma-70 family RNA polymerase sigma factor [Lactobacillus sp. PSON]|uniref:sigma-70 family RNA polymerase sigma factor n=1 Tax=Lactobacillus sp. PSON TaxID=3455454 RepID=UPI004042ABD2
MKITKASFNKAWKNKKLVAGALKMAHVRREFSYYEDYLQEGVLTYAEVLDKYPVMERKQIDNLAFRKIIWRTIDQLRKVQKWDEYSTNFDEAFTLASKSCNWEMLLDFKELVETFNDYERLILFEHLLFQRTITDLVSECGVSRQYLQRIKRSLLEKLREELN